MNTLIYRCSGLSEVTKRITALTPAIFFDRDGTIIEEKHYLKQITDIRFLHGVISGLKKLKLINLPLYLVTNQAGIAHGYFDESTLEEIHLFLLRELAKANIFLKGVYYCPHHPTAKIDQYCLNCYGRKPEPGLLFKAAEIDALDLNWSYFIGDKLSDIAAGKKAGMKTILVLTGYGKEERAKITMINSPDYITQNFLQATNWILKDYYYRRLERTSRLRVSENA